MALKDHPQRHKNFPDQHVTIPTVTTGTTNSTTGPITAAVLRIATGLVFLWAFLDKTFGLGYATPDERA